MPQVLGLPDIDTQCASSPQSCHCITQEKESSMAKEATLMQRYTDRSTIGLPACNGAL